MRWTAKILGGRARAAGPAQACAAAARRTATCLLATKHVAMCLVATCLALASAAPVRAQTWTVRDGADSLAAVVAGDADAAARLALARLADDGFLLARVDSAAGDPAGAPVGVWTLFVSRGPEAIVASVTVDGATVLGVGTVTTGWATRAGAPFRRARLDADVALALDRYAARGIVGTRITPRLRVDGAARVAVQVVVDEGAPGVLAGVELSGGRRPARAFASRVAGVAPGDPLAGVDPEAVRRDLESTGLYTSVGPPERVLDAAGRVVLRVPVVDGPPGAFDAVLGYLPAAGGQRGQLVGSGRVELRNLFGGGRTARVALDRTPGLGSAVQVSAADPFVLGLPLRVGAAFDGLSRDSTFSRQTVRVDVGTRVAGGLDLTATFSRDAVAPGRFGAEPAGETARVRRSTAVFAGAGIRYRRLDAPFAPRRGLALDVTVESGIRRRAAPADSVAAEALRQQRLTATGRLYVPTLARQSVVLGVDARVLVGGTGGGASGGAGGRAADEGELFRIGGAASLRGYDEDALVGSAVGRAFAEPRYHLDAESFAFAFFDLGYVARPDLPGRVAERGVRPGYGAGAQLRTGLGLITLTYALRPDLPAARGRVHVGLGFGL